MTLGSVGRGQDAGHKINSLFSLARGTETRGGGDALMVDGDWWCWRPEASYNYQMKISVKYIGLVQLVEHH